MQGLHAGLSGAEVCVILDVSGGKFTTKSIRQVNTGLVGLMAVPGGGFECNADGTALGGCKAGVLQRLVVVAGSDSTAASESDPERARQLFRKVKIIINICLIPGVAHDIYGLQGPRCTS